jgi:hypothetical protein
MFNSDRLALPRLGGQPNDFISNPRAAHGNA